MKIKNLLERIPFIVPVYKNVITLVRGRSNKKILKQLEKSPYPLGAQLKETLESLQRECIVRGCWEFC